MASRVSHLLPQMMKRGSSNDFDKLDTDLALLRREADQNRIDEKAFRERVEIDPVPFAQKFQGKLKSLCTAAQSLVKLAGAPVYEDKERYQVSLIWFARMLLEVAEIKRPASEEEMPQTVLKEIERTIKRYCDTLPAPNTGKQLPLRSELLLLKEPLAALLANQVEEERLLLQSLQAVLSDPNELVTEWANVASRLPRRESQAVLFVSWLGRLSRQNPQFFEKTLEPLLREKRFQTPRFFLARAGIMADLALRGCPSLQTKVFEGAYGLVYLARSDSSQVPWQTRAIAMFHLNMLRAHATREIAETARLSLVRLRIQETHTPLQEYLYAIDLNPPTRSPPMYGRAAKTRGSGVAVDMQERGQSVKDLLAAEIDFGRQEERLRTGFRRTVADQLRMLTEHVAELSELDGDLGKLTNVPISELSLEQFERRPSVRAATSAKQEAMAEIANKISYLIGKASAERKKMEEARRRHDEAVQAYILERDERADRAFDVKPQDARYVDLDEISDALAAAQAAGTAVTGGGPYNNITDAERLAEAQGFRAASPLSPYSRIGPPLGTGDDQGSPPALRGDRPSGQQEAQRTRSRRVLAWSDEGPQSGSLSEEGDSRVRANTGLIPRRRPEGGDSSSSRPVPNPRNLWHSPDQKGSRGSAGVHGAIPRGARHYSDQGAIPRSDVRTEIPKP